MPINTRTETKDITPESTDFELDEERGIKLENSHLSAESQFDGKLVRPISAGSMAMLQRTKNGLIFGDATSLLFDTAAFVLIHIDDETHFATVRRAIFKGDWPEFVINWLDSNEGVHSKLSRFAPRIRDLMNEYGASLTRQLEESGPGNAGGHIG